jgi:hypothetical protein
MLLWKLIRPTSLDLVNSVGHHSNGQHKSVQELELLSTDDSNTENDGKHCFITYTNPNESRSFENRSHIRAHAMKSNHAKRKLVDEKGSIQVEQLSAGPGRQLSQRIFQCNRKSYPLGIGPAQFCLEYKSAIT